MLINSGVRAAVPIRPLTQFGAFEPEVISAMSEAFDAALKELQDGGQPEGMREVIANRIVAAARFGERDPVRLLEAALGKSRGEQNGFVASAPHQVETCMKLSARNAIAGTVIDVTKGQTTAHVQIDIGGGQIITASITNEAIDELQLAKGQKARAVIKASDVMIATD
jgi:molybdopterin-binding protein